jgi:hypothetical protein
MLEIQSLGDRTDWTNGTSEEKAKSRGKFFLGFS